MKSESTQSSVGTKSPGAKPEVRPALKVVLAYLVFATLWIYCSGGLLRQLTADANEMARWEVYKGWGFVVVTAALLYYLLSRLSRRVWQARSSLEQSEARYRKLVTASPDALLIQLDQKVAFVNPAAVRMFGAQAADQLLGRSIFDLVHSEDHQLVRQRSTEVLRQQAAGHLPVRRLRRSDGSIFFGEMAVSPTEYHGGHALQIVIRDVTVRRQTENALVESETRLRLALASARQGLYDLNLETGAIIINGEYAQMLGYDPAHFQETEAAWLERMHPDDRERVSMVYRAYLAGQIPEYRVEFRQRTRDGTWKWILSLGRIAERSPTGQPRRLLGTHTDITPQKLAEQRVHKLNRLHAALAAIHDAILRHQDRAGLFHAVCQAAVKPGGLRLAWIGVLEASPPRLVPTAHCNAPPDYLDQMVLPLNPDQPASENPVAAALLQGQRFVCNEFDAEAQRHPWCQATVQAGLRSGALFPLFESGKVMGGLCFCAVDPSYFDAECVMLLEEMARDISAALDGMQLEERRVQTLAALRDSETRFRRIVETASEGIWVLDAQDRTAFANRQMTEMLGCSQAEMLRVPPEDFLFPEDLAAHAKEAAARRSGHSAHYERRLRRKDGTALWTLISATPILGEDQVFQGSFAMFTNITQRKLAEDARRESEARFRRLFAGNPLPMWVEGGQPRRFLEVNAAAVAHYGYSREQFLQMQPADLRLPEERADARERSPLEAGKHLRIGEVRHRLQDGRIIFADLTLHQFDFAGQPAALVVSVDVTERRHALQALHELSGRLLRLQDEERRHIARELHDTTTQNLAALNMNLSLLRQELKLDNARWRQLLADCEQLAGQCNQEIRTLSYLLHPPILDVLGLPGALNELLEGFDRRSGITTTFAASPDFGRLPRDVETALFRVAQESLGNIHRHSGSPTAQVRLKRQGQQVTLTIADAGHGIPAEKLAALQSGLAALGVGVAGMRERLHQLGGRLRINSGPKGTCVLATVSLDNAMLHEQQRREPKPDQPPANSATFANHD